MSGFRSPTPTGGYIPPHNTPVANGKKSPNGGSFTNGGGGEMEAPVAEYITQLEERLQRMEDWQRAVTPTDPLKRGECLFRFVWAVPHC